MPRHEMTILPQVWEEIKNFIGLHPAERGGVLGMDANGIISRFVPDPGAATSAGTYSPNVTHVNQQLRQWESEGISFAGFVHSHPANFRKLSDMADGDTGYAKRLIKAMPSVKKLWLPIVMTVPDAGKFEILPFVATPQPGNRSIVNFAEAELKVLGQPLEHAASVAKNGGAKGWWVAGGIAAVGAVAWLMGSRQSKESASENDPSRAR